MAQRLRVHEDGDTEGGRRVPHGSQRRVIRVAAGDAGADLYRGKSEGAGDGMGL